MSNNRKKYIVIGAGVSGASAVRELIKLGISPDDIVVLEKNDYIGGKLRTYTSPSDQNLKTEYGAGVLVQNYPVIDAMYEKGIHLEKLLPADHTTLDIYQDILKRTLFGKATFAADFLWQNKKFCGYVSQYENAYKAMAEKLPAGFELPFAQFSKENGLEKVNSFLQFLVPGFGYGNLEDEANYAARMFNYMRYTTILGICAQQLKAVHGGYQQLPESMLAAVDVKTSAQIKGIEREPGNVKVTYEKDGELKAVEADNLILANSPYYWPELNMKLTAEEQRCVDDLKYYRYPVAICNIKGLPAQQIFIPEAMRENGFGHAAFLFTRDNRENPPEGRLFTVYINLPEGKNNFDLAEGSKDRETIIADLKKLPGVTDVTMKDSVIWPDYNPTVPYIDSINLEKAERAHINNTLHIGAYRHDSFETVAGTSRSAISHIDQWLNYKKSKYQDKADDVKHALKFFNMPRDKPYEGKTDDITKDVKATTITNLHHR